MPAHVTRIESFRRWLQRAAADRTIELRGGTAIIPAYMQPKNAATYSRPVG